MKEAIIFFTRVPLPGKTKTRLLTDFSPQEAARIHKIILTSIFNNILSVDRDIFVYINPMEESEVLKELLNWDRFYPQIGENLNEKMQNAIFEVLDRGYERVILLGSDLIGVTEDYLQKAFDILDTKDIVIGPSEDGGYCLIGMKKKIFCVFDEEKSSHSKVLENLISRIDNDNLSYELLEEIYDVDLTSDFNRVTGNTNKDIDEFERIIRSEYERK
ncbi:TIGR04282 family arsenosugar biosynthesis glycosyltransferase [Lagierella sp.]|uniref:TIGR04282 family arsenosugar biosynthesis glycosyltransferase n=1 Tax=Lagierella sp. TaxID=2849657 RepID=UPI00260CD96C|nr:TIGR04282 family arsenosugar biosynthesis glycosyltransferase [Lagierella sp.]